MIVRSSDILLPAGHHVSKYAQLLGLGRQIVVSTDWLTNSNWQNMYFNLRIASAHELFHAIEDFYNPLHFVASDPGRPEGCRGTWLIEGLAQWAAGAIHHDRFTSMADMLSLTRRANGLIFDSNSPNWTGKWSPIGCEESEYYGVSPVFWTFFAEQLGTDVYINGLDGSTVIVRGADIVEELLGNWASSILYPRPLSLTNDIVKNHRTWWPTTATIDNFFLNWFEANAVKDYVSQSPQNLDWSLYLYSSFVPGDARCAIVYDKVPVFTQTLSLPIQYTETVPSTMARYSCAYYDLTPPPLTSKLSIYPVWDDHGTLKLIPAIWPVVIPFGESGPLDYPVPLDASTQSSEKVPSDNCFDLSSYQGITRLVVLLPNYGGSFQGSRLVVRSSISDCCPLSFLTSCPVDLAVTDPSGRAISKQSNDVENAFYGESFLPGDSADVYDRVILLQALPGLYQIRILPDSTARPDDLFSVRCVQQGEVVPIALNVRIGDIPAQGYVFNTLPFASLTGPVKSETGVGLTAVPLDIYDNLGNLWQSVVTDDSGFYHVDSIPNGDYTISVVTPLGYQADEETKEFTINHVPVTVDFTLTKLDVTARPRTRAWWANQLHRALANCPADYNRAAFARFAGLINQHFNQNAINPVDFYSVPQPATQQDSLNFLKQLLNLMPCGQDEPFLQRLGKGQLIALMLNVVSGKIHQMQEISSDGSSVSQAITYCDMLVNDEIDPPNDGGPGCGQQFFRYLRADFILTLINLGLKVPAGMIPADVIEIAYKLHVGETMPAEFALQQNYPNPFNPLTDIRFSLPEPARVRLDVYDILGRNVATLIDESLEAGEHIVQWDGRNVGGRDVASGIYFYRIVTKDFVETKKMVLIR